MGPGDAVVTAVDVNVPLPPQNLEAEEYVLGAMMLSPQAIEAVKFIEQRYSPSMPLFVFGPSRTVRLARPSVLEPSVCTRTVRAWCASPVLAPNVSGARD
jgi:hypothetical protein